MAMVSRLYSMATSDVFWTREERERRLRVAVQRLVAKHGQDDVLRRVRGFPVAKDQAGMRETVVLAAWRCRDRAVSVSASAA
jgi:hypothetical protein